MADNPISLLGRGGGFLLGLYINMERSLGNIITKWAWARYLNNINLGKRKYYVGGFGSNFGIFWQLLLETN